MVGFPLAVLPISKHAGVLTVVWCAHVGMVQFMPAPLGNRPSPHYSVAVRVPRTLPSPPVGTPLPGLLPGLDREKPARSSSVESARWLCENYCVSVRG
jgi:hypothetical protein